VEGFRLALDEVAREKRFLLFEEAPSLEHMRAFVASNIASGNPQFVALADGVVVGWCDVLRETGRPSRNHCGTLGIGLVARHRGKGLGRLLLGEVLAAATSVGIKRVELTVRASNHAAIALYRAMGFVDEGRRRAAYFIDGLYGDSLSMAYLVPELRTCTSSE
jgi:ribosomal protein S18 acetylase RimI-like enzyme